MKKLLSALMMALVMAPATAVAAPGGVKGPPGETVLELDQSDPRQGDTISFTVESGRTDQPWVALDCYRDGFHIYSSTSIREPHEHLLASLNWTSGTDAEGDPITVECTASAIYVAHNNKLRTLATIEFLVIG